MASPLQLETPEQKRLRIEQEKLQQQMGNIGFSSIESPAPVETTELPEQTVSPLQSLKNFAKTIPSYEQDTSVPVSINIPKVDTAFTFEDLQNKARQAAIKDREIQRHDYSKPYSVEDLELGKGPRTFEGESFIEVAERHLSSIGEREDIFETMRDSEWSVGDAIALGIKSKNWTYQQKKDYAFLKSTWDSAELNDWGQILEATKDIGIDIIADPMNLFFAYLTLQTGGAAALALTSGAKIATNQAVKQGMLKVANNKTFRAASIGLTEGAYDAGMLNLGSQLTEVNTGLRKELDKTELGVSTAIGAGLGVTLAPAAYKTTNYLLRRKTQKVLDDLKIEMDKGPVTPKIFEEYNSTLQFFDSIMSNTTGKATSKFIEVSKVSPVIKQFILGLNPKALQRITTARSDIIDAPIRATSREGDLGYSTDQERLSGLYTTFIDEVLDSDIFGRVRDRGNGWWNLGTALDTNDNLSLAYLLTKGDLLDNYIKVTPANPNKPFVNLQVQSKVKNVVPDSRITEMQEKYGLEFSEELYEAAAKIRYFFKQIEVDAKNIEGIRPDGSFRMTALLDEEQSIPNYFHRILDYDAITATPESRKIFRDMLVRSGHADPINTVKKDDVVIVEEAVKMKGSGGREKDIPDIARSPRRTAYIEDNTIDKEYFKNLDSPFYEGQKILERFDSFEDLALDVLRKENGNLDEVSILQRAKELKADALMRKLEEEQYFKTTARTANGGKTEFLNNRVWYMLDDEELISNGFINTNMLPLLKDYGYTMGQKITEAKYFGFGSNFRREWIPEIRKELERSGKFNKTEINKILSQLEKIKDLAVGSPNSQVKLPTRLINTLDVIRTTQVLAHLPFAAVSSITEPFIALSKADLLSDTPSFVKEYAKAGIQQIRKNIGINGNLWKQISLSTGRKVYGFKNLTDEEFLDVKRWGVAVEQSMMARIEGMFAENIQNKSARNLNNMFFNLNLLQPWTQAVQIGSFNFAKARTIRITRELTEGKTQFGRKLTKNEINFRREQLHDLGIDYQDSINAYQNSIVNGKFNLKTFQDQPFYDTQLNPGAQLFAKEIILNPSASNLNKPAWFSNPFAQLAFQFAGYPTAFNNTVLKGFARELTRYPLQSAPSILAATTMMVGTAHLMNTIRSRGENLKNDDQTLLLDAVERPGLLGSASHIYRFSKGQKYNQGFVGGVTKAFGGPFLSDYTDAIQYSSTPYEVAIQNAPFWGALSTDSRREWRRYAKNKYHDHFGKPKKDIRSIKRKGGIVEDVLNVKSEPDEVKMRGLPYTYSEVAGPLFQDEEERGAFAEGGEATSIKDKDSVYNYLTKDEDEYNVFIDKDPIRIYTKETLPDLDIKDTYYTVFKGNTVSDRLNSVRQSSTIGLPVTKDKTKVKGGVKASGKIKFKNVLKLDIDLVTPDSVQAEINNNMDSIIKIEDKVLGKEIINATTDNLNLRDAVLNKDDNVTNEKKKVIERNKSFLVRHQLLKLGYDAIETNEGYTLLRENQFLPTEIMERTKAYGGGMVSTLNRRQQYGLGGRLASKLSKILMDLPKETLPPPKKTEALDMLNNPSKADEWKANNKVPKEESKRRKARKFPEQATALEEGTMSGKEYRTYLKENQPAETFSEEDLNTMMPDFSQVVGALDKNKSKQGILGLNSKLKKGERTTARLDIPAYNYYDTWVTSMTQKGQKYYGRTGVLSEVTFDMFLPGQKKAALDIAKGKINKFPYATMKGTWEDLTDEEAFALAKKYINDPEWTQVGFNPERASYFYDKKTMLPVFDAELVIQIGPLVLAKQAKLTPARRLERMLKIRKLRMETRAEGARPAIFNKGGEVREQYGVGGIASKLAQKLLKKQTAKKIETPFKKVTPENYNSLFGGHQKDAVLLSYPKYAALKGKKIDIVDMTPDEYIKESAKLFGTTPKSLEKGRIENTKLYGGQELIDKIKNSMKQIMEGKKVKFGNDEYDGFAPVALYAYKQQEGLHRAIAAKQLGIKKIPVIVEKNIKKVYQDAGYNYFREADRVEY